MRLPVGARLQRQCTTAPPKMIGIVVVGLADVQLQIREKLFWSSLVMKENGARMITRESNISGSIELAS